MSGLNIIIIIFGLMPGPADSDRASTVHNQLGSCLHPIYIHWRLLCLITDNAVSFKEDGNNNFKLKKYRWAIDNYAAGIKCRCADRLLNAVLYSNRAVANYHLGASHFHHHHHHWAAMVSRGWAMASACRLHVSLSCAVRCHIVSLQYLSRSSLHRLAGLPCRFFLLYDLQVVTREVHRSSFRRLMCPAQDHFIFFVFFNFPSL